MGLTILEREEFKAAARAEKSGGERAGVMTGDDARNWMAAQGGAR